LGLTNECCMEGIELGISPCYLMGWKSPFPRGFDNVIVPEISHPAVLEVLVCLEALLLSVDLLCRKVIVASDHKGVVEDIKLEVAMQLWAVVKKINISARDFTTCSPFLGKYFPGCFFPLGVQVSYRKTQWLNMTTW
jgi:hypothetical protein